MKIYELFEEMKDYFGGVNYVKSDKTCDTFKSGDANEEIKRIGVSMFATVDVIKECMRKNINLLIVHEPVYYNHMDNCIPNSVAEKKKQFIEESGVTIVRYHDYSHLPWNDMIYEGEIKYSGLQGKKIIMDKMFAVNRFEMDDAMTARELAALLEKNLGIKHIKIAGEADKPGRKLGCCFGTPGRVCEELEENDFVLTGEICEWEIGEFARDYAQFGYNKAILVMGHIGSERAGMMYLADMLKEKHPNIDISYIECSEVYTYTD